MVAEGDYIMAGWKADRLAGSQADEMLLNLEIFKIMYWMKHWNLSVFRKVQCRYSGTNTF